jgi:hypothetical protein
LSSRKRVWVINKQNFCFFVLTLFFITNITVANRKTNYSDFPNFSAIKNDKVQLSASFSAIKNDKVQLSKLFPPIKITNSNFPHFFRHEILQSSKFRTFSDLKYVQKPCYIVTLCSPGELHRGPCGLHNSFDQKKYQIELKKIPLLPWLY